MKQTPHIDNVPEAHAHQSYTLRPIWRFILAIFASPIAPALLVSLVFAALEFHATQKPPVNAPNMFAQAYLGLFMVNVILCVPTMVFLSRITDKRIHFMLAGAACLAVFSILAWGFLGAPLSLASIITASFLGGLMMTILKSIARY